MSRAPHVRFSSSSDDDEADQSLAQELQAAASRERKRNPHAEGRAKGHLSHQERLHATSAAASSQSVSAQTGSAAAKSAKPKDLFASSSSSSSDDDEGESEAKRTVMVEASKAPKSDRATDARAAKKSDGDDSAELRINASYAQKFEEVKRKQELQRLTEKYEKKHGKHISFEPDLDDGDDEEDEEDDDAVLLTKENELAFAKALLAVRKAAVVAKKTKKKQSVDPKEDAGSLKSQERFFPPVSEQLEANTAAFERAMARKKLERQAKNAGFTLSDEYQRALHATAEGDETYMPPEGEGGAGESESSGLRKLQPQTAEERRLRAAFLESVKDDEAGDEADSAIVSKTGKTSAMEFVGSAPRGHTSTTRTMSEEEAEREAAKKLLAEAFTIGEDDDEEEDGASSDADGHEEAEEGANHTEGHRRGPRNSRREEEHFLQQFFLKELWRGHGDGSDDDGDSEGGDGGGQSGNSRYTMMAKMAQEEEANAFYDEAEEWEREYQEKKYRHEDEEADHLVTYPRPVGEAAEGLLRKRTTARKDARQRRRERLEEARQQQAEELKRLKHLKRQEIDEKRALIASVAGLMHTNTSHEGKKRSKNKYAVGDDGDDGANADHLARLKAIWTEQDMEADFDPVEFDKKMAMIFNDEYYDDANVDEAELAYFEAEKDLEDNELLLGVDSRAANADKNGDDDSSDSSDDSDDDDSDGDGEDVRGVRAIAKEKRRALAAALTEEPEIFHAETLEEAKRLVASQANNDDSGADGADKKRHQKRKKSEEEEEGEDVTAALLASTGTGNFFGLDDLANVGDLDDEEERASMSGTKAAAGKKAQKIAADDALYPSDSAQKAPALVAKKREIDDLMKQYEALSKQAANANLNEEEEDDSGQEGDRVSRRSSHKKSNKGEGEKDASAELEATLARLKAELKQKEHEYDLLHHDAVIGGGTIKTRFRYREVPAEDFTLSVEDILARDDRQLNMIAPMSCYAAYLDQRSNLRDRWRIERRLRRGFREVGSERASRRYGDLKRTVVFDPAMDEAQGQAIIRNLAKRLREDDEAGGDAGGDGNGSSAIVSAAAQSARGGRGSGRGGGGGGSFVPRGGRGGRGGWRGAGGEAKQSRVEGGQGRGFGGGRGGGRGGFRGGSRGGRGRGGAPH